MLAALAACAVAVGGTGLQPRTAAGQEEPVAGEEAPGAANPFDLMEVSALRSSPKKVFAHFFAPYPVSFDNKPAEDDFYVNGYISPQGENGKHAGYGGYFRQAPHPRFPRDGEDWKRQNLLEEVRQAVAIGLDGFCFDMLTDTKHGFWETLLTLLDCAEEVDPDFKIMLMPDMTAVFKKRAEELVPIVLEVAHHPSILRDTEGRVVIAPFNAHAQPPEYWRKMRADFSAHSVETMFFPLFQAWWDYLEDYAPISDGISDWGCATVEETQIPPRSEAPTTVHAKGKLWMAPVRPQDFRPRAYMCFESTNSELFRSMWQVAIEKDADWVQLITWNDYSESTEIRPSTRTGYAFYYLSAFYTQWFKTGNVPEIKRDALFYFYRIQSTEDEPDLTKQSKMFTMRGKPSNQIELLAFLKEPATLEIELAGEKKSMDAPEGMVSFKIPLKPGTPIFRIRKGDTVELELTGRERILNSNEVVYQDLLYRADCIAERK